MSRKQTLLKSVVVPGCGAVLSTKNEHQRGIKELQGCNRALVTDVIENVLELE